MVKVGMGASESHPLSSRSSFCKSFCGCPRAQQNIILNPAFSSLTCSLSLNHRGRDVISPKSHSLLKVERAHHAGRGLRMPYILRFKADNLLRWPRLASGRSHAHPRGPVFPISCISLPASGQEYFSLGRFEDDK